MSVNTYSIPQLLVGHVYNSRSTYGKIISATKDEKCTHFEDAESYVVELANGQFRTVAVKIGE